MSGEGPRWPHPEDVAEWAHLQEERIGVLLDSGLTTKAAERLGREHTIAAFRAAKAGKLPHDPAPPQNP